MATGTIPRSNFVRHSLLADSLQSISVTCIDGNESPSRPDAVSKLPGKAKITAHARMYVRLARQ